jgi:hypothetical protein
MATYIVEIGDEKGNSFKISLSIGWAGNSSGSWRSIDKGRIRYNSGATEKAMSPGELTVRHLLLFSSDNTWGLD